MWAALRESFVAGRVCPASRGGRPLRDTLQRQPLGNEAAPANLVSGREKTSLADHARGVNWPFSIQWGNCGNGLPGLQARAPPKIVGLSLGPAATSSSLRGQDESGGYRMWSRGGRQCLQPSSQRRVRLSGFVRTKANRSGFDCPACIRCLYQYQSSFFHPSSSNCVQGHRRRLGVLGLREAMGYAMTCRRRLCGHGEAPAKVAHPWLRASSSRLT